MSLIFIKLTRITKSENPPSVIASPRATEPLARELRPKPIILKTIESMPKPTTIILSKNRTFSRPLSFDHSIDTIFSNHSSNDKSIDHQYFTDVTKINKSHRWFKKFGEKFEMVLRSFPFAGITNLTIFGILDLL